MLNNVGPKTDPCEKLLVILTQLLSVDVIHILCDLLLGKKPAEQ